MAYINKNNYREQAATRKLNLWTEPAVLPARVQTGAGWISGFVRAAMQTASPTVVREFFRELDANDSLLSRLGWALMAIVPVFAAFALFASGSVQGVNPWIKPIKFSISFSTFASTVSLFLLALKIPEWQLKLARRAIAVSVVLEITSLGAQAWRTAHALAGRGWIDGTLAQMTNSMVMVNTAIVIGILALFCANRVRIQMVDGPMISAIRYSIVIFLAGNAAGGYMLARGSHTVGVADGGPGLPFVNWSTIGGDLRIAHFIAIHAIQIVPLFAYVLSQMAPIPTVKQRRLAVAVVAIAVGATVAATFVQAALGRPFLPLR
ncbi:MAG: hypothetical protein WA738_21935 [Candidatus Angelobacter sp.]